MKAVIIDDEPNAVELLILRLAQCCPQVEVAEGCTSSVKGVAAIRRHQPDVVFLDMARRPLLQIRVLTRLSF